LHNIFFNLEDSERSIIGTNFPQIDEVIKDYLVYKGLVEPPRNNQSLNSDRTNGSAESPDKMKANLALRKG